MTVPGLFCPTSREDTSEKTLRTLVKPTEVPSSGQQTLLTVFPKSSWGQTAGLPRRGVKGSIHSSVQRPKTLPPQGPGFSIASVDSIRLRRQQRSRQVGGSLCLHGPLSCERRPPPCSSQVAGRQFPGNEFRVNELFGHLNIKGRQGVEEGRERGARQAVRGKVEW